jgi:hypothetical protein
MSRSRQPRRRRGDPIKDAADRMMAVAFESPEAAEDPEVLGATAAAAIRIALYCVDMQVHATGRFDDDAVADFIRSIAMAELQKLRRNRRNVPGQPV